MIRIAIVDDHPAVRAGLETVLEAEPDLVPVGGAERAEDVAPLLTRTRPDLVLLDYHLPGSDGLQLCRRIKEAALAPRVILYSAYAGAELAIPALLAGADGVVAKSSAGRELFEAIRTVAAGERVAPPVPRELMADAAARLDAEDLPILGMLMDGTPNAEVCETLRLEPPMLQRRVERMIGRLRVEVPGAA